MTDELLSEKIDAATVAVENLRSAYERENVKRDRRIRLNQILIGFTIVVAILGVSVGVGGYRAQRDANNSTTAARLASCLQYNRQQRQQAAAEKTEIRTFLDTLAPAPRDASTEDRVDAFLPIYDKAVDRGHPPRDCTPFGIRAFLNATVPH